ncbi:MAG: hypothetical protein JNN20_05125 [Betaproteobacteria bacterium]|nr:hypothetical protein [Betaproteobacteria bacterium]
MFKFIQHTHSGRRATNTKTGRRFDNGNETASLNLGFGESDQTLTHHMRHQHRTNIGANQFAIRRTSGKSVSRKAAPKGGGGDDEHLLYNDAEIHVAALHNANYTRERQKHLVILCFTCKTRQNPSIGEGFKPFLAENPRQC